MGITTNYVMYDILLNLFHFNILTIMYSRYIWDISVAKQLRYRKEGEGSDEKKNIFT